MIRKLYLAISLALCLAVAPQALYAQKGKAKTTVCKLNMTQKEKQLFAYGFYKTYMNSLLYTQVGDLSSVIAEKFVSPSVMKKSVDMDADVLIDAQDCAEDNIRTLTVVPLSNDWLCVSYLWRSPYKDVGTKRKVVYIKVKEQGKSFVIEDATTKKPDLRK
ncbi:hypothetical protein [Prevotella jejuni]|uniref:hypothetical protein n=1 Tax=Prevotella jejuni TaxID=1177574 RepID=UPI0028EF95C2|nr:hypothetical protein [Prevotella jejuni]